MVSHFSEKKQNAPFFTAIIQLENTYIQNGNQMPNNTLWQPWRQNLRFPTMFSI